ncbi:MAG: nuclear transport factor 2 family protein [Beijerinckiaceae bacterium]
MTDIETMVRAYGDAWLEKDAAARDKLLEIAWSKDGVYQDPTVDVSGREALSRHIAKLHQRLPGSRIVTTSAAQHHHGKIHFTWKMLDAEGKVTLEGRDFGELDSDGRICRVAGFFGSPPPLAG